MCRFPSFLTAAALLALDACNSNTKPDKPEKVALAAPPAVPTSESAKSLVSVATSDTIWNGAAVSDDDRKFVLFPHNEGDRGTRIGELQADGKVRPYPNRAGNLWMPVPPMNRTAGFQKGVQTVAFPVRLFKMPLGAKPFRD